MYLEKSRFLPVFNNERKDKNDTLKNGLLRLEKMVLVLFKEDKVVIPKETAVTSSTTAKLAVVWLLQRNQQESNNPPW